MYDKYDNKDRILNNIVPDPSGCPSLYHVIVIGGVPSALQFNVTGSCRGTIVLVGCSTILGPKKPAEN